MATAVTADPGRLTRNPFVLDEADVSSSEGDFSSEEEEDDSWLVPATTVGDNDSERIPATISLVDYDSSGDEEVEMASPISALPNSPRRDLFSHIYSRYDSAQATPQTPTPSDEVASGSTSKECVPAASKPMEPGQTHPLPVNDPTLLRHIYDAARRMPENEDWPLFRVACKKGQEAAVVNAICLAASKLVIRSAYSNSPGWLYLEAVSMRSPALISFLREIPGIVFKGNQADSPPKWFQVPREDWLSTLHAPSHWHIQQGSWVQVQRGKLYKGDVGLVIEENPRNMMIARQVRVLLIPRLHTPYAVGKSDISKLLAAQKRDRPAQALLPVGFFGRVVKHYKWRCRLPIPCNDDENTCCHRQYNWQSQTFDGSLIIRSFPVTSLTATATISSSTQALFLQSGHADVYDFMDKLPRAEHWIFRPGDRVEVLHWINNPALNRPLIIKPRRQYDMKDPGDLAMTWGAVMGIETAQKIRSGEYKAPEGLLRPRKLAVRHPLHERVDQVVVVSDKGTTCELDLLHKPAEPGAEPLRQSHVANSSLIRKVFTAGEHVEVVAGSEKGISGFVLQTEGWMVVLKPTMSDDPLEVHVNSVQSTVPISSSLMPSSQSSHQPATARPVVIPRTDPRPWIHQCVKIVSHKGLTGKEGIVRDVTVNHNLKGSKSGILVNVALQVPGSLQVMNIDYNQLRDEHGAFLKLPTNANSVFKTKRGYQPQYSARELKLREAGDSRRQHGAREVDTREAASFLGRVDTQPSSSTPITMPVEDRSMYNPDVLTSSRDMQWVVDLRQMVQLSEVAVMVDIVSGPFKGQNKFVYVNDIPGHVGLHKARSAKSSSTPVPMGLLAPSTERPHEMTESRLMLVVKGEHTGKFVRRIGMRYESMHQEALFVLRVVQIMGEKEANRVTDEELKLLGSDLALVKEHKDARMNTSRVLKSIRDAYKTRLSPNLDDEPVAGPSSLRSRILLLNAPHVIISTVNSDEDNMNVDNV